MLSAWKRLLGGQTDGVPNTVDVTRLGPLDNQDPQPIRIQVQQPAQPISSSQVKDIQSEFGQCSYRSQSDFRSGNLDSQCEHRSSNIAANQRSYKTVSTAQQMSGKAASTAGYQDNNQNSWSVEQPIRVQVKQRRKQPIRVQVRVSLGYSACMFIW